MANWYYSVGGKAEGPVTEEFLIEGLKAGRLTLVDLVFREGEAAWCTLGEIERFREAFQAPPPPVMPPDTRESQEWSLKDAEAYFTWVVLKKKGSGFEQTGPYSAEQIIEGLATGDFEYSQYAWKPGYKRWVRIGNLPEFDRRKRDRDGDPVNLIIPLPAAPARPHVVPSLSREELMENVMRMERTQVQKTVETAPEETNGINLVDDGIEPLAMPTSGAAMKPLKDSVVELIAKPIPETTEVIPPDADIDADPDTSTNIEVLSKFASEFAPEFAPEPARVEPPQPVTKSALVTDEDEADEDEDKYEITQVPFVTPRKVLALGDDEPTVMQPFVPAASSSPVTPPAPVEPEAQQPVSADTDEAEPVVAYVPKVPVWKKAARLFVAGAAVGVGVIVALPYIPGLEDFVETQEGVPAEESEASVENPTSSGEISSAQPNGQSNPQPVAQAGQAGVPVDPNLQQKKAANSMESQPGVPTSEPAVAAAASAAPPQEAAATQPTSASQSAPQNAARSAGSLDSASLGAIQPTPPGAGKTTTLDLVPLKLSTATPMVMIQTNAPVGEKIAVNIRARSGEVLRLPSVDRRFSFVRAAGDVPGLDLAKMNLPAGTYRIEVSAGDLRKAAQVFIGSRDAKFESEMELHLKSIAFQQQVEKKALFYTAKRFEQLAKSLSDNFQRSKGQLAVWREFYSGWKRDMRSASDPIVALTRETAAAAMAYPEEIRALRTAIEQLGLQAGQLDTAVLQKRDVASQKPLAIIREFSRLKAEAAMISARR